MRGKFDPQAVMFTAAIDLEQRVRAGHPLRAIKRMVDEDLAKMSRQFDSAYADEGRPSVPPERLIKALLLQSLYSVRSEAQLVEPKGGRDDDPDGNGFKSRNAEVDFHGQKRSNATHESSTDPDAKLMRKSDGKEAKLCHALHALIENRHGLVLAVEVNSPLGNSEPETAITLLDRVKKRFRIRPRTVGADKGYGQGPFLAELEDRGITPHAALKDGPIGGKPGTRYREQNTGSIEARRRMRRRQRSRGYSLSQRCRKKIEEMIGWAKTIGGLARTRLIGHRKTSQQAHIAGAAFNLLRMRNLSPA
jgi:hypothetical protein